MSRKILCILSVSLLTAFAVECWGYGVAEHKTINEWILDNSVGGFDFNKYLKKNLRMCGGMNDKNLRYANLLDWLMIISYRSPRELIAKGGVEEDKPELRCLRHFHDPLKSWDRAGLNNGTYESSILWAQRKQGEQSLWNGGNYSWYDARGYYYNALTGTNADQRSRDLSNTFLSVGHLMHLIEDSSVPEHVRDNSHLVGCPYEKLLADYGTGKDEDKRRKFNDWLSGTYTENGTPRSRYTYDEAVLGLLSNSLAPVPLSRIVDTEQYRTSRNPGITVTQPIGLAEYTNANFFSKSTIFTSHPYPSRSSVDTNPDEVTIVNPRDGLSTVSRLYINKIGDGDSGYRLCTAPLLWKYSDDPSSELNRLQVSYLDDKVIEDYAERLVPRAVSYSAGLLRYFFRGMLEVSLPSNGVYAFTSTEPSNPRYQGFNQVSVLLKNTTSMGEKMLGGTIELVVQYKLLTNDPNAADPRSTALDPFIQYDEPNLPVFSKTMYIVKALDLNNDHTIPADNPELFAFNLSNDEIPLWAVDVAMNVIYRGKLGNPGNGSFIEEGSVCVGSKKINDPTPLDIINDTDTVCVDGEWKRASAVNDLKPRTITNFYLRLSPENQPQVASPADSGHIYSLTNLAPGKYKRVYLLSDNSYNESVHYTYTYAGDDESHEGLNPPYLRTAIKDGIYYDEANDTVIRYYPLFKKFRNISYWNLFFFYNMDICTSDPCPEGCDYADNPFDLEKVN